MVLVGFKRFHLLADDLTKYLFLKATVVLTKNGTRGLIYIIGWVAYQKLKKYSVVLKCMKIKKITKQQALLKISYLYRHNMIK